MSEQQRPVRRRGRPVADAVAADVTSGPAAPAVTGDAGGVAVDAGGGDPLATDGPVSTLMRDAELEPARLSIAEILDRLPTDPGVYLMKDRRGKAIYIGKAGNLRSRVRQYFQPASGDTRLFVPLLEGIVADIETVVTTNEKEALLLENTLIKRHQPRFNVNLRDDKNYLVLRLDPEANWPRLEVGRKIAKDGAYYFGPYHSATSCREALRVVNRHFQLRTCTDHVLANRRRPCLQYQIKRCPAPCVLPVDRDEYADQVRDVRLFLEGKDDELVGRLTTRMKDAAAHTNFEQAAAIRDQLRALEVTLQAQRVVSRDFVDQDIIGLHREGLALEIVVMTIRQGKMVGSRSFSFGGQEFPDSELLSSFIGLLYDSPTASIPDELLLPLEIDDAALKGEWLSERRPGRRRVEVLVPQRGDRKRLADLAQKNAQVSFSSRRNAREDVEVMLAKLQRKLRLNKLPRVIECYDISHIQGFAPVASMVVFVNGRPERTRYRTYRVRGAEGKGGRRGNDDFASMYEVLSRRFRRAREGDAGWELPDLVVIDGGKGQLGMALAAARDVGIDVRPGQGLMIVGLAKEREGEEGAASDAAEPTAVAAPAAAGDPAPEAATQESAPEATQEAEQEATQEAATRGRVHGAADPLPVLMPRGAPAQSRAGVPPGGAVPSGAWDDTATPETTDAAAPPPALMPAVAPAKRGRRSAQSDRAEKDGRRPDRIYLPNAKDAIPIRPSSAEMFVLQHLRDEAHRFAVSFHRRRRGTLTLRSALAEVPGIGPQRQRLLLRHFGSLKKIREATAEELAAVPGMNSKAAAAVAAYLGAVGRVATSASSRSPSPSPSTPASASQESAPLPTSSVSPPRSGSPSSRATAAGSQLEAEAEAEAALSPGLSRDADEDAVESAFAELEEDQGDELADGPGEDRPQSAGEDLDDYDGGSSPDRPSDPSRS